MIDLTLDILLSYLLGSLVGSLLLGRLRGGVDIRTLASGNAGATNALRTQGKSFALGVLLIDIAKGWVATRGVAQLRLAGSLAGLPSMGPHPWMAWSPPLCGLAVILGHVYPLWYGFRGGKGVATLIGVLIGLAPALLLPVLVTWLATAMLFGFVSLASMVATASVPIAMWGMHLEPAAPLLAFGLCAAVLIMFTHRANIGRMAAGTEPRARRLWLFGKERA